MYTNEILEISREFLAEINAASFCFGVIVTLVVLSALVAYSALIVAGRSDRQER